MVFQGKQEILGENAWEEEVQVASEKLNLALYSPIYCKSEQRLQLLKGLVFIFAFFFLAQDRCILSI